MIFKVFDELLLFTKRLMALLTDESFAELQDALALRPDSGKLIKSSGGLRKVRWAAKGRGKSGGVHVIYYWWVSESQITLCNFYSKNEQENISAQEIRSIRAELGH